MNTLAEFLDRLAQECDGIVTFERFMREALYAPEFGYYSAKLKTVGREGDFSTWPTLGNEPAKAVARWLRTGMSRHVIEVGAGTGALARGILKNLGFFGRQRITYHIVDVSPALIEKQRAALRGYRVQWHSTMGNALAVCDGQADIISNELVDAFPCRVFVNDDGTWRELAVRIGDGHAREELLPPAELPESSVFGKSYPAGQRVEIHESYRKWVAGWLPRWDVGRMLTIDYGGTMPDLYDRRPGGTVRAYSRQERITGAGVYAAFGKRDITADVNFTDLERWGEAIGLRTREILPLGEFIIRQTERMPDPRFADAGAAFFVLEQEPKNR